MRHSVRARPLLTSSAPSARWRCLACRRRRWPPAARRFTSTRPARWRRSTRCRWRPPAAPRRRAGSRGSCSAPGSSTRASTPVHTTTEVVTTPPPPPPTEQPGRRRRHARPRDHDAHVTRRSTAGPPSPAARDHGHAPGAHDAGAPAGGSRHGRPPRPTGCCSPGSGSGLLWMVVAAVLVLALGSAGGLALSRRR